MYRLLLTAALPDSHMFRTRIGVGQSYGGSTWTTDAQIGPVYVRWMTCGKSVAALPPADLTGVTTFLYDGTIAPTLAVPDSIELDLTRLDTLHLEPMTCIAVVNRATGAVVEVPIQYTVSRTIIDVDGLSGVHRLFFVPKLSVAFTDEDLVAGKYTLFGNFQIHGVVKSEVCVFDDWTSVKYENNQTIVDFGVEYSGGGDILYSPSYIISTYVNDTATYVKVPTEYPATFVDLDNMLVVPTINLFNGFTSLQLGDMDHPSGIIRIMITEWAYYYLKRLYGDSLGVAGAIVRTTTPSTAIYDTRYKGYFETLDALEALYPTGSGGDFAFIGGLVNAVALWNTTSSSWVTVTVDGEVTNVDTIYTRAGTVTAHKVYCYKNSAWVLADPDDVFTQMCALWMSLGTNAAVQGMTSNAIVDNVSWNWTTVDGPLYVSTAGAMTETAPTIESNPGEVVRPVGYVLSATKIRFLGYLPGGIMNSALS